MALEGGRPGGDRREVYLFPGMIFAESGESTVTTVLGSCISVCLWLRVGGINHYLLPLWNGGGLPSPRYGNIAIGTLVERMRLLGCASRGLQAKVFGGGAVIQGHPGVWNIGERNAALAEDLLHEAGIPIVSRDVGGQHGRRILFRTTTGEVLLKRIPTLRREEAPAAATAARERGQA